MKPIQSPSSAAPERRGAALMLSFMVLVVLIVILAQIRYSTDTAGRVARNEETVLSMDLAIESAMLQVYEDLKSDGQSDSAAGAAGAADQAAGAMGGGGASESEGPTDSREDAWARPQRTELNEIQLRILIQDEDSKFNVLSVLTEDEDEADKALDRLTRTIELARKGTEAEIDNPTAQRMAEAMREFMRNRSQQPLPRPKLLSDSEEDEDVGLPLSLRELVGVDPELFTEDLFREFIDKDGQIVHSLGTFLTVWTSVSTPDEIADQEEQAAGGGDQQGDDEQDGDANGQQGNGEQNGQQEGEQNGDESGDGDNQGGGDSQGGEESTGGTGGQQGAPPAPGWAINVNTAPAAVLNALVEARELPYRFWENVMLYRNEKDESVEENDDPPLDEYGNEIVTHKFYHSVDDLSEIDGWEEIEPILQGELKGILKTQSNVFSIFITARKPTGEEQIGMDTAQDDIEREEANWQGLVRTVHAVVWRRDRGEGEVDIVPLVRWEVVDYVPFEVQDYPPRRDYR